MTFRLRIDPVAQQLIDKFADYLREYSEDFAIEQIDRLTRVFSENIQQSPLTWGYFVFTGAPYPNFADSTVVLRMFGWQVVDLQGARWA